MAGHMFPDGTDSAMFTHRDGYDEHGQLVGEGSWCSHGVLALGADADHGETDAGRAANADLLRSLGIDPASDDVLAAAGIDPDAENAYWFGDPGG